MSWLEAHAGATIELAPIAPARLDGMPAVRGVPVPDPRHERVHLIHGLVEARLTQPKVAYCEAGTVNGTDKRYQVIESVLGDTEHGGNSIDPVPAEWRGKDSYRRRQMIVRSLRVTHALQLWSRVFVCSNVKIGRHAVILNRR